MCLPGPAAAAIPAGIGLSLAGEALNTREANKSSKNMVSAWQQSQGLEDARQAEYRARAQAGLQKALAGFSGTSQADALAAATAKREADLTGNVTDAAPGGIPISKSAPNVVKETVAKRLNDAVTEGRAGAKRLAALGARDDVGQGNQISFKRAGEDIGVASNFAAASAGINPVERMAAYRGAYRDPSGLGDLFKLFGQGGQLWGFMGTPGLGGRSQTVGGGTAP